MNRDEDEVVVVTETIGVVVVEIIGVVVVVVETIVGGVGIVVGWVIVGAEGIVVGKTVVGAAVGTVGTWELTSKQEIKSIKNKITDCMLIFLRKLIDFLRRLFYLYEKI